MSIKTDKQNLNTHGKTINYGKHKGELFTRLPLSYLKWIINENAPMVNIAKAEFKRRGDSMPKVELSPHAINNASLRCLKTWESTKNKNEGIYSWLERITLEAIEHGKKLESGKIQYAQMKFVIVQGEEYPVLKTIMCVK